MPFIVFEGLDGSGKSSLMERLEELLKRQGIDYVRTREPGGTLLGEELRHFLVRTQGEAPTPRAELLLYEAIRAQHVDRLIRPALQNGRWVICDRYVASSIAFQAAGRQISEEWVRTLNDFATDGVFPDLVVLLDLSVAAAKRRREKRNRERGESDDRIESEAEQFHHRVRESFLEQARSADAARWLVLDAEAEINQLQMLLEQELKRRDWIK
ncbi:MAG: dTMP kinase [Bdellovibrionaceae bacterium]|nr:dTMP kinase [Pseudobdellovibrionaceae bacterium]MDW8190569.1 dTMP kinase [Pseudobdellovibrionaceae bacterium]